MKHGSDREQDQSDGYFTEHFQRQQVVVTHPSEHGRAQRDPGQDIAGDFRYSEKLHHMAGEQGQQQNQTE